MILELDQGNTRLKWRLLERGRVLQRGAILNFNLDLASLCAEWADLPVEFVRAACVASAEVATLLAAAVRSCFDLEIHFATVTNSCAGIECAYSETGRLGVDRWVAVVAASRQSQGPCLVVDSGSALTVDLLYQRRHLGGYIAPGYELMRAALYKDTAAVKIAAGLGPNAGPGRSTEAGVNAGLWGAMVGLVVEARRHLQASSGSSSIDVLVCGGDAESLISVLPMEVRHTPDLVLDGLAYSVPLKEFGEI